MRPQPMNPDLRRSIASADRRAPTSDRRFHELKDAPPGIIKGPPPSSWQRTLQNY